MSELDAEALYCAAGYHAFSYGVEDNLLWIHGSLNPQVVPRLCWWIIGSCRTPRTLEQQAHEICENLGLGPERLVHVQQFLNRLVESELLVRFPDVVQSAQTKDSSQKARIQSLSIVSSDRPELLRRCVMEFAHHAQMHGHSPEFVVCDDSRSREASEANSQMLKTFAKSWGNRTVLIEQGSRERFVNELIKLGLPTEAVRFGFQSSREYPVSTGSARNAVAMQNLGNAYLTVDDDTRPLLTRHRNHKDGIILTSEDDPRQCWPLDVLEESQWEMVDGDLIAAHEAYLGADISGLTARFTIDSDSVRTLRPESVQRLVRRGGKVVATFAGSVGDSGSESNGHLLLLEGEALQRMVRTEEVYMRAMASRSMLRLTNAPTITENGFCMTLNAAFDNREFNPPFLPVMRNQDGVFGALLRTCFADTWCAYIPFAVRHDPVPLRGSSHEDVFQKAAQFRTADVISLLINDLHVDVEWLPCEARVRKVGASLTDIASLDIDAFHSIVTHVVRRAASRKIESIDTKCKSLNGSPLFLARDLRRYIASLKSIVDSPIAYLPTDLAFWGDSAEITRRFQSLVRRFGLLLSAYSDIIAGAKLLRKAGIEPGEKIV